MRGVIFKGNREAEIREFPDPHAGPGEAVVKIRASGLCGTDLHRYRAAEAFRTFDGATTGKCVFVID
jgi:threonine dehydrogenase-like Zn-dependent dehydrogenase